MNISRREALKFIATVLAATGAGCLHRREAEAQSDWPSSDTSKANQSSESSGWPESSAPIEELEAPVHSGFSLENQKTCSLSQAETSSFRDSISLSRTSGNSFVDQRIGQELHLLGQVTGFHPGFAFFDDSAAPNAFATSDPFLGSNHGSVCFGTNLLGKEWWQGAAALVIMMHEWTHIAEFNIGARPVNPQMELLSDFMAGWYLAFKESAMQSPIPYQAAIGTAKSLFDKGDYNFNSQSHHGTPQQRVAAMQNGYAMFRQGATNYQQAFHQGRRGFGI